MTRLIGGLDRLVAAILSAGRWLLLPVVALLFLQWPLRGLGGAGPGGANYRGQWLSAFCGAGASTAAPRPHTYVAGDAIARHYSEKTRTRIARLGALLGLVPWALFVLIAGAKLVLPSLQALESFADTNNPGYFIVKLALWLLAGLMLMQAVVDILRPRDRSG